MRVDRRFGDDTENEHTSDQQKVNQEKPLHQAGTAPARSLGDQPSGGDGAHENGKSQDLVGIYLAAAHQQSRDDDEITSYMGGEHAQGQESRQINHTRNNAKQDRNPHPFISQDGVFVVLSLK
jgi:hypothetical protein